jgi:superfamily II DNA or RNA helicase
MLTYEPGATIEVRGATWRLTHAQRFDTCIVLTLEGRDRENAGTRLRVIAPFDRPRAAARRRLRRRPRRAVLSAALAAIASARPRHGLWTAAAASVSLWPYQLEPALAVIRGATRVLLADAVGLGKTIQAALILSELRARGWVEHALIVTPAGLRDSWRRELRDRFQIDAAVLDHETIAARLAELPPGVSPWSGHAVAIASIDFIKRAEVLSGIAAEPIDLLIVDEAHHLAPATERAAAVSQLASRAPWCVLASATPHSGDHAAFAHLISTGAAGDSDAMTVFRRQRSEVGLAGLRRTHLLPVHAAHAERALLDAVARYASAIWQARGRDDHAARLVAATLARRAASSPQAIARTLAKRLALLAGDAVEPPQPQLPWDEQDESDDLAADSVLAVRGLEDGADERAAIAQLIELAAACGEGAKLRRIERLIDATREPAVIFTEYRDTLEAMAGRLAARGHRIGAIHGGLAPAWRRSVVDAFNRGPIDVLVATDAAGEGLNLHHRCRLVIDNELPWNPLRLEQRVGRVDRLGQQRPVHAIRLFHPRSIEHDVLAQLRMRSRRAEAALDGPVSEAEIADAVFSGHAIVRAPLAIRSHAVAAAVPECLRLDRQRRFGLAGGAIARVWAAPRHRRGAPLIAVFRSPFVDRQGALVEERVHAHRIRLGSHPATRRDWRAAIEHLDQLPGPLPVPHHQPAAVVSRIGAIRTGLRRAHQLRYQRSLFDARADADAAARQAVADRLDAGLQRALRAAAAAIDGEATRIELIAAWLERS